MPAKMISHLTFLWFCARWGVVFLGLVAVSMYFLTIHNGVGFAEQWRWFHDAILVVIFWKISFWIMGAFIIGWLLERFTPIQVFNRIPAFFYYVLAFTIFLPFCSTLSQVFGGCIWFYFFEHWWVQYIPYNFFDLPRAPYQLIIYTSLYLIFSVVFYAISYLLWRKGELTHLKNNTLTTH